MRLIARLLLVCLLCTDNAAPSAAASADVTPAPARSGSWPLAPPPDVVRGFELPAQPWGAGHRGVDLLGHTGDPVRAALGGTIIFAAPLAGRGVVVVDHGAMRTTYEPVRVSVHVGDVVTRGDVIGTLQRGSSHCFPRACLHWGLLRASTYLDQLTLVGGGPVRLLPLGGLPGTLNGGWREWAVTEGASFAGPPLPGRHRGEGVGTPVAR